MMKKQLLLFQMMLLSLTAFAQSKPYAVLSDNGQTVTFYYNSQKDSRGGIDINNSFIRDGSKSPYGNATTAVFDGSFANYRPESTAYWFQKCSSLTTINGIKNLKTDNVTNMGYMFRDCSSLESIDVSGFNTYKVTDLTAMFDGCSSLTSLDVSGFNTSNVTDMSAMFQNCSSLTSLDVSGFMTHNVTRMSCMFNFCSGLTSLDVSRFNTSNVTEMNAMFQGCSGLTSLDVSGFKTSNATDISSMFSHCSGLTNIDVSGFETSKVIYMHNMFWDCPGLTSLDVSGFETSNVTHMFYMFNGCSSLTSLDVSGFKTSNVVNMCGMFSGCSGLTNLDVSGFKTPNVTDMSYMFWDCSGLTSLDLRGFDTSNVKDIRLMFYRCYGLTNIYVDDDWNTARVTNSDAMFGDCTSIVGGNGTTYNHQKISAEYARIDKPGQPGYFSPKEQKMESVENGETIDIGHEIDKSTDIDGNVVGNVYYSISSSDGSYDPTEGCVIVSKPTDDSAIDGKSIFGEDFNDNYTGLVFRVAPGSGTVTVQAQTTGDMVLKVKIGNGNPATNELSDKQKVSFPYKVSSLTYVYIYGGSKSAQTRSYGAGANGELKIYGIEVVGGSSDIESIEISKFNDQSSKIYNLNGQRVNMPKKGIYIQNGKKVLVK